MKRINFFADIRKPIGFAIMFIFLVFSAHAQLGSLNLSATVASVQPQFIQEYDSGLGKVIVSSNVATPVNFKFNITIKGDSVLLAQTNLTTAPSYTCLSTLDTLTNIDPFDGALASMNDYYGYKASLLAGVVPVHNYQVCITLVDASTYETITTPQYYYNSIQTYTAPSLAFPGNADTVSNSSYRVKFQWNWVTPATIAPTYYKLTVVPVLAGQTTSYALAHNTPVLVADSLLDSSYSWHPKGDSVVKKTNYSIPVITYAWQVYAYYTTGTSLGTSSAYSFTVSRIHLIPQSGSFSNTIATENSQALEFPDGLIAEYDSVQKAAYGKTLGPWTHGANKTSSCDNGNWEDGDTANWTPWLGYRDPWAGVIVLDTEKWDNPGPHSRTDLIHATSPVYDPRVGGSILPEVWPGGGGHYTMRLGPDELELSSDSFGTADYGGVAQAIDYDLTLTGTPQVKFWYALVLQHGGHEWIDNGVVNYSAESEFLVRVTGYYKTVSGHTNFIPFKPPIDLDSVYSDIHDPANLTKVADALGGGDTVEYKNWSCKAINLPSTAYDINHTLVTLASQTVTLEFLTTNCLGGGHFGYAYIDGLCEDTDYTSVAFTLDTAICPHLPINVVPTTFGGEKYYWSVQRCSANGDTLYGTEYNAHNWVIGQPSSMDIGRMMYRLGVSFIPGDYYRVKLVIHNDCDDSLIATHVIHILKLYAIAGDNHYICSTSSHSVTLGGSMSNPGGTTYSWTSVPSGFSSSLANPTASPSSSTEYILSVTNSTCTAVKDTVQVYISPPITSISVSTNGLLCKGYLPILTVNPSDAIIFPDSITWKTTPTYRGGPSYTIGHGDTLNNFTYTDGIEDQNLTVYARDACGNDSSLRFTMPQNVFISGSSPLMTASPNSINFPDWGGTPTVFTESDLSYGETPAYGATSYIKKVYATYSDPAPKAIATYAKAYPTSSPGFSNGEITWNGQNQYSIDLASGTYYVLLQFTDCDGNVFDSKYVYYRWTPAILWWAGYWTAVYVPDATINVSY